MFAVNVCSISLLRTVFFKPLYCIFFNCSFFSDGALRFQKRLLFHLVLKFRKLQGTTYVKLKMVVLAGTINDTTIAKETKPISHFGSLILHVP